MQQSLCEVLLSPEVKFVTIIHFLSAVCSIGSLHHPPHPYHSCQLQQVGETHLTCILLFPKERLTWPLRPASVIDVLYLPAECIFLFLHKEFCIDVFCIYGIKWKKVTPPPLLLLLTQSENTQPSIKYAKPASELSERDK